ncbi:MAG: GNAT family N-acetyltransferase [Candidatus Dadabacteria bacterium]
MSKIKLISKENEEDAFVLNEHGKVVGEMLISIDGDEMTVTHTEVSPELEGKGYGQLLFDTMVEYARDNHLKVIPLCAFVNQQFKRHPDKYRDIWETNAA